MAEPIGQAGVLARILAKKREEVAALRRLSLPRAPQHRPFRLDRPAGAPLRLIAEIKRRSPSAGALSTVLGVDERAASYERAGAAAISVLTDAAFFDGSFEHLTSARRTTSLPILCKDFVIDEAQLDAARAFGADAVLVIVRCLDPERVSELVSAARNRGLEPLVEIATESELEIALDAQAKLVGVNARDLDTLEMHPERAARVLERLPGNVVAIHFSGLSGPEDVAAVARSRADAALIGEALMRADDPAPLLERFRSAAQGAY